MFNKKLSDFFLKASSAGILGIIAVSGFVVTIAQIIIGDFSVFNLIFVLLIITTLSFAIFWTKYYYLYLNVKDKLDALEVNQKALSESHVKSRETIKKLNHEKIELNTKINFLNSALYISLLNLNDAEKYLLQTQLIINPKGEINNVQKLLEDHKNNR